MGPALELEGGAVGGRAAGRVHPDAGRPARAGAHQGHVEVAGRGHHTPGRPAVQDREAAAVPRVPGRQRLSAARRRGPQDRVLQVGDQRLHGLRVVLGPGTRHHQQRQSLQVAQVGAGHPLLPQRGARCDPDGGHALLGELAAQFPPGRGIPAEGLGDHGVALGRADRDPDVGQVGVDLQVAVARAPGDRRGRRHAHAHQSRRERGAQLPGVVPGRVHQLGDTDGPFAQVPAGAVGDRDPCGGPQSEPRVGRIVQRPREPLAVHLHEPEPASDHRVGHLVHRQPAAHVGGPADPDQAVGAVVAVDGRRDVQAVHALPEREPLRVAEEAQVGADGDPGSGGGVLDIDVRRDVPAARGGRAGRREMPGALAEARVPRVLLLYDQLVADVAGAQELPAALRPCPQAADGAAARGVDRHLVELVADGGALAARPLGDGSVGEGKRLEAHAGHFRYDDPEFAVLPYGGQGQAGVVQRDEAGVRHRQDVPALPGRRVEDHQVGCAARQLGDPARQGVGRVGVHGPGQVVQLPPAGEQVDVDLVGLRAGDGVVVGAVDQLPPGLVERRVRIGVAGDQGGERRPGLRVGEQRLTVPLGLLGVDVGDVLAGVDRVHVPGLR